MSLVILSKSPKNNFLSKEFYFGVAKQIIRRKRGPDAVLLSLLYGLKNINFSFKHNPKIKEINSGDIVFVNNSIDALKLAIEEKKKGNFKKLIAGPNLVVTPNDFDGIINSKEIDLILQPSEWVKNFYLSISPNLEDKIKIWPAGVFVPKNQINTKKERILIYFKNCSDSRLLDVILNEMKIKKEQYDILFYGKFKQKEYYKLLEKAKFMIYISNSESQGLALQEAWARNVPTLVWNSSVFKYGDYKWWDNKISAPYLTQELGLFFKDSVGFKNKLAFFLEKHSTFSTAEYVQNNLSDTKSAENFLELIK